MTATVSRHDMKIFIVKLRKLYKKVYDKSLPSGFVDKSMWGCFFFESQTIYVFSNSLYQKQATFSTMWIWISSHLTSGFAVGTFWPQKGNRKWTPTPLIFIQCFNPVPVSEKAQYLYFLSSQIIRSSSSATSLFHVLLTLFAFVLPLNIISSWIMWQTLFIYMYKLNV